MQSVHLQKTPNINEIPYNENVVGAMSLVRKICNAALSIRKKNNIKARIPLACVTICGNCEIIKNNNIYLETIKDEINVKEVVFLEDSGNFAIKKVVNLNSAKVAKRLGKNFQAVLQQAKAGNYENFGSNISINGHEIFQDEFEIQLVLQNEATNYTSIEGRWLVVLETEITPALQNEGIARDFVRAIQNARKEAGLNIANYINLEIYSHSPEIKEAIKANLEHVSLQVLAKNVNFVNVEIHNGIAFGEDAVFKITL